MHTLQFRAMGCQMLAMIDTELPEAVEALTRAPVGRGGGEPEPLPGR